MIVGVGRSHHVLIYLRVFIFQVVFWEGEKTEMGGPRKTSLPVRGTFSVSTTVSVVFRERGVNSIPCLNRRCQVRPLFLLAVRSLTGKENIEHA